MTFKHSAGSLVLKQLSRDPTKLIYENTVWSLFYGYMFAGCSPQICSTVFDDSKSKEQRHALGDLIWVFAVSIRSTQPFFHLKPSTLLKAHSRIEADGILFYHNILLLLLSSSAAAPSSSSLSSLLLLILSHHYYVGTIRFDIRQTIHMKWQALYSLKNTKQH